MAGKKTTGAWSTRIVRPKPGGPANTTISEIRTALRAGRDASTGKFVTISPKSKRPTATVTERAPRPKKK